MAGNEPTSKSLLLSNIARRYTQALRDGLGDALKAVVLFSSVARGEATPNSDVDLLVVMEGLPARRLARHE